MADTYDLTKAVLLKHLEVASQRAQAYAASAIRSGKVENNTVKFYTTEDKTGTEVFSFDFPSELVLDQLKTNFVPNFAFNASTYAGATDPSLDGKPVLVIAVKDTNAAGTVTTTYSFLNMENLVDIYTAADNSITINGYTVAVKVSPDTGNALSVKNNGLYVDISDKADKVANATAGNIAALDANGNLTDSGHAFATDAEVNAMLDSVFGASA